MVGDIGHDAGAAAQIGHMTAGLGVEPRQKVPEGGRVHHAILA